MPTHKNFVDITGDCYGRLTVESYAGRISKRQVNAWSCRCSCGDTTVVSTMDLRSGHTKSCGCLKIENGQTINRTHGMASRKNEDQAKEYRVWKSMLSRCRYTGNSRYHRYGGRGIKVCDEWSNSFEAFYEYMGKCPEEKSSIDRICNDSDYEPGNVRWATPEEQGQNTSLTRLNPALVRAMREESSRGKTAVSIQKEMAPHACINAVKNAIARRTWKNVA